MADPYRQFAASLLDAAQDPSSPFDSLDLEKLEDSLAEAFRLALAEGVTLAELELVAARRPRTPPRASSSPPPQEDPPVLTTPLRTLAELIRAVEPDGTFEEMLVLDLHQKVESILRVHPERRALVRRALAALHEDLVEVAPPPATTAPAPATPAPSPPTGRRRPRATPATGSTP